MGNNNNPKLKIYKLYNNIQQYSYNYYVLGESTITDYEFDNMINELYALETKYPQYKIENSPTDKIYNNEKNIAVKHINPMLSLSNTYSEKDLLLFDRSIRKKISWKYQYVCELKLDGIALSIRYVNGKFYQAITRGNGLYGEDITYNIKYMADIPMKIDNVSNFVEIRGEIIILKSDFNKINEYRKNKSLLPFSHGRSFIIGVIKLQHYNPLYKKILKYYAYDIYVDNIKLNNHFNNIYILKSYNLTVSNDIEICNNINKVIKFIAKYKDIINKLNFHVDGIVIKINQYKIQQYLGNTSKYPKWAIAYKYPPNEVESIVLKIVYQVGRTGLITPIAKIKPINISDTIVKSINLHNYYEILRLDIRINDTVYIKKSGEIIPKITGVNLNKRLSNAIKFIFSINCPSCNSKLIISNNNKSHYCINTICDSKIINKIVHFISKNAMNIDNLGIKNIELLYKNKIINNYTDLYSLKNKKNLIMAIKGFNHTIINKILYSIDKSRKPKFQNFLFALGIPSIGIETSILISKEFNNINELINYNFNKLPKIMNIGPKIVHNLHLFFSDRENKILLNKLLVENIEIQYYKSINKSKKLNNIHFIITGTFKNYSRNELIDLIHINGGIICKNMSSKLNYVIAGNNMGPSKKLMAEKMNIKIISVNELLKIIN